MEVGKKKREKIGGRIAGTPNKITTATREGITAFLNSTEESFAADWAKLEPAERVRIRVKLMEFVVPKQREITGQKGEPLRIEIVGDASKLTFV